MSSVSAALNSVLSPDMATIVNIEDIGQQIQAGIGIDVADVQASEVTLVTEMPDDSGSIRFAGNTQAVRDGHNLLLDALGGSKNKQKEGTLIHCRYLNGFVLFPFVPLSQAIRMDQTNYDPNLGTPLYDQAMIILATVLAKARTFEDSGVPCRTVTLLGPTDGADESSRKYQESDVFKMVTEMLQMENHIIAGMGIDDGRTDFYEVYSGWTKREVMKAKKDGTLDSLNAKGGMGVQPRWVMTPSSSPSEIRKAMGMFSQSAIRASQSGVNFSQTAAGGFGA